MSNIWLWILIGSLVFPFVAKVVIQFILTPIILRKKFRISRLPNYQPTEADQLTPEMQEIIGEALRQFGDVGFQVRANVYQPDVVTSASVIHIMLVREATQEMGSIVGAVSEHQRSLTLAIITEHADRRELHTASSGEASILPPNPLVDSLDASWTRDVRALNEAHRRRLATFDDGGQPRVLPQPGGEIAWAAAEWERSMQRSVKHGYYRPGPGGDHYRLTWKGAILMGWRSSDPIRRWRTARHDRRARRAWAALGMNDWRAPNQEPQEIPAPASPPPLPQSTASHDSASTDFARVAPSGGALQYQAELRDGEIRSYWTPESLTLHAGAPSRAAALRRRWGSFLSLAIFGVSAFFWIRLYFQMLSMRARFGVPMRSFPRPSLLLLLVFIVFTMQPIYTLIRTYVTARGTTIVTAGRRGLAVRNAPTWKVVAEMTRSEIQSLRVRLSAAGWGTRAYQLEAIREGDRRVQSLIAGSDKDALEEARTQIAVALGIETRKPPLC